MVLNLLLFSLSRADTIPLDELKDEDVLNVRGLNFNKELSPAACSSNPSRCQFYKTMYVRFTAIFSPHVRKTYNGNKKRKEENMYKIVAIGKFVFTTLDNGKSLF